MTDLDIVAFVDESKKPMRDATTGKVEASGDHYVVAAAIVLRGDVDTVRSQLHLLLGAVGHDLHYSHMSARRRANALTGIAEIDGWDGLVYETSASVPGRRPERRTRARILTAAFLDLTGDHGVRGITLETRATPIRGFDTLDQHDHATWRSLLDRGLVPADRTIAHGDKTEPLLWVADLLAGARTDHLCGADRSMYPLIAHRVRHVTAIDP